MSRRGLAFWLIVGFLVVALGVVMLWVGLEAADQLGSVIGGLGTVVGLGMSAYAVRQARSTQRGEPGSAEPLPPPGVGLCVGRDAQVREVVAGWAAGRLVAVVGGPGIGKSTVLGTAIADPAVVKSYGARRFVVSCEGAESAGAVVDKMAQVLGVPLGEHLRNRVLSFVRGGPCVVVLDNFETVSDGDPSGAAELVADLRAGGPRVAVGIGYRGGALPPGVTGADEIRLGPLTRRDAADVFAATAGNRHRVDPNIDSLLADLDGVPLAIVLLATLARTEPRLDTLLTAWRAKRTDLLRHATQPDRTSSLPVSIELSWDRLSPDARAALSLAAFLPDGWPHGRSAMYLPDELAAGVIEIAGRALLHDDEARQRCLAPIRHHVLTHHAPPPELLGRLTGKVRVLAERCGDVGHPGGAETVADLAPEFTNIAEAIRAGMPQARDLAATVPNLLNFQRFAGLGDDQIALAALASAPTPPTRAAITLALAQFYTSRSDNDRAREMFDQALSLYQRVENMLGEATCLTDLGELEFHESNNDRARDLFDQALPLHQRVENVLGEANCLRLLGRLEFIEFNNDRARDLFDQALPLYQRVENLLGQANCLANLGQLEFREANNDRARDLFGQALPLYQRVGDVLGQAGCLASLGDLEFRESNNDRARDLFGKALPLYQRVGSVLGEANCVASIGEVEFNESNNDHARELFERALHLYRQIRDRYSQAFTHAWLARATSDDERSEHCAHLDRLATELNIDGFREKLRAIAGC